MDNEKIAAVLYKIHSDDLKDAEMLTDYAEEIIAAGDTAIASAIVSRAKNRLNMMQECERSIENVLMRMTNNNESKSVSYMYEKLYKDHMNNCVIRLKDKLSQM